MSISGNEIDKIIISSTDCVISRFYINCIFDDRI